MFKVFVLILLSATSFCAEEINNTTCWQCEDNKLCISRQKICDGIPDCPDSSDENANCHKFIADCLPPGFRCDYGACVKGSSRCDGVFDCADGSDERKCYELVEETNINKKEETVTRKDETVNETCQVEARQLCDGYKHCKDGSDETRELCSR